MRKKAICIFFLSIILGPVAGLFVKGTDFFQERPFLTPFPVFTTRSMVGRGFYKGIEGYLDDRNPFRGEFIKTNAWMDVSLFHTSPTPNVHIGLHGWLYFKPAFHSFFKADCSKRPQALRLARRLHNLELVLKKAGKRFIFVVAPDKSSIYPEYMGGVRESNNCGKNFFGLFLNALKKFPVQGFVRLDKALLAAKKNNLLYYSGGTHWNDRGAVIASKLILKKLSTPEVTYRLPKITFQEKEMLSETAPMISANLFERAPFADKIGFSKNVKTTGIRPLPFFPNEWVLLRTETQNRDDKPLLPKAMIYRDSFMTAPIKILKSSFREIFARWTYIFPFGNKEDKEDTEELATSKIIIIEAVERNLDQLRIRPMLAIKQINRGKAYAQNAHEKD